MSAPKARALLATLLCNPNQVVSTEKLVDELWPEGAPSGSTNQVHRLVSRLRRTFGVDGRDLLVTRAPGYQLVVDEQDVDASLVESMVKAGRQELRDGAPERAAALLRDALVHWRGPVLADVPASALIEGEATRLTELHQVALEVRIDCDLACGKHAELIGELRGLVASDPLRERTWAQLITAQHRSGRKAEALKSYENLRDTLATELGIDPSPQVDQLRDALLTTEQQRVVERPAAVEPTGQPSGPGSPAPAQLPPDVAAFIGREDELARLTGVLRRAPDTHAGAPVVSVISGMAGVGKTALAVHWAHRVRDHYPDGQLHLDLHGFDAGTRPVEPAEALRRLACSLGVPAHRIPDGVDERSALLRSELSGRRVLILLDDAAAAAQVQPLIPAAPGCLVLVTSRRDLLTLANTRPLRLAVPPTADAVRLLNRAAGLADPAATPLAADIVELCGRLPLAVRMAGARLRSRASWSPAHLAERLADRWWRLHGLRADGKTIAGAFQTSYLSLDSQQCRMFRLVSLHPGADVEPRAAAVLAGTTVEQADRLLEDLVDAHLLDQPTAGRYAFHPLLRDYATTLVADAAPDATHRAALELPPVARSLSRHGPTGSEGSRPWHHRRSTPTS
ncbi:BTAD domain-containing putative transcriptional regulator [Saccharothrix sp. BKS2]|uniref:AfsR/SARP family transcriptional regulator n=1 Tax=Saccharothrix sp. BKS2 TaxID=3064400 RepID=UPI0039EB3B84